MKSKLLALLGMLMAAALLLFFMRDSFSIHPFKSKESFSNISKMTTDASGALYLIADSKSIIKKVSRDGVLLYAFSSSDLEKGEGVQLFNEIATDASGNAYVVVTILDAYGLKVLGEQIVQVSEDGSKRKLVYEVSYSESDNLLRVGNIQSLSVADNTLYFFQNNGDSANLMKVPVEQVGSAVPAIDAVIRLSGDKYINELTRGQSGQFYLTTKRGTLYAVHNEELVQLHPLVASDELHFPVSLAAGDPSSVYFIDSYDAAVKRINTAGSEPKMEVAASAEKLSEQYPEIDWSALTAISYSNGEILLAASDHLARLDSEGTIKEINGSYTYPNMQFVLRIAYWVLLIATLGLVLLTLRSIYIDVMKRRVFLLIKQLAVILPVVLISMTGLSYSIYTSFAAEMKDDTYKQLRILAANGKYLVDGDSLERLESPRDYGSTDYMTIKERVNEVFSRAGEDRDGLYNTIYRVIDGQLFIVMDDDDSAAMFEPFPVSEENQLVIQNGEIVLGEWKDESGEWMYAIGPLFNAKGQIVGIYETGKDMTGIVQSNKAILADVIKMFALISLVLIIVITLMTSYFLSSIRKLRRNVNLIASGEWDVKVNIQTRDEVEELGDRFNMMAGSIKEYIQEVTRLSNSYFRFVPQQFLKVLGTTNMSQLKLGEQQNRSMTILVCNVRKFNEMSSSLSTDANFQFINSFLRYFGPVIREYGGFTSRYLGPGMLTMFPNDAGAALKAAIKLRMQLQEYNEQRERQGLGSIDIGISIHSGDVMLGIIGEEQRMEGSVVSNHVQMTLDLERLSSKLGVNVLLTKTTLDRLGSGAGQAVRSFRHLGMLQIDEDHEPIELYDWYEADPEHIRKLKAETKEQFEAAVEAFRSGRFYDAREGFVAVVKKNRYDLAAKLYFFECDRYFQEGVSADWNHALHTY